MPQGFYMAQVLAVHPGSAKPTDEDTPAFAGTVSVLLSNGHIHAGTDKAPMFRIRVGRIRAFKNAGEYVLPEPGEWGIVAFFVNDPSAGIWICSTDDLLQNMVPEELWQLDPYAILNHFPSDRYSIHHGDATEEHVWPDGSLLKITTRKDGQKSNPTYRASKTPRKARRKTGEDWASERQTYTPQAQPPVDIVLQKPGGFEFRISADGSLFVTTPRGNHLELFDDTEQARQNGSITGTGSNNGQSSGISLRSQGASIRIMEDGTVHVDGERIVLGGGSRGAASIGGKVRVTAPSGTVIVQTVTGPAANASPIIIEGEIVEGSQIVKLG